MSLNSTVEVSNPGGAKATIIERADTILVTGAGGFIGSRVVQSLIRQGFEKIRCLVRPSGNAAKLRDLIGSEGAGERVEVIQGNLLSLADCRRCVQDVKVVYHLAAGRGEKSFPDAFLNSVVTTRNLLKTSVECGSVRRFVSVSSFTVYANQGNPKGRLLDENCPTEDSPHLRGEAYCYAKARQEDIVVSYGKEHGLPWVILRPGYVYGPGNEGISSRVGIGTFGLFLHLGGGNPLPLSYVDNCAEAIVLAGLRPGVDGEIFNVVDDDLISSRRFLRLYKKNVRQFPSIYLPGPVSWMLCLLWEKYSEWSQGQLPLAYNRRMWRANWKGSVYTNTKLKSLLGWRPIVSTKTGLELYFASCRKKNSCA